VALLADERGCGGEAMPSIKYDLFKYSCYLSIFCACVFHGTTVTGCRPPTGSEGRQKSFQRGNNPPPPH
jgi:hypothetical protein